VTGSAVRLTKDQVTLAAVVVALAASPFAMACSDTLPDQDLRIIEARPVARLSAALLWQDFQTVRDQADRSYNGRAIVVIGEVARAGSGNLGDRYVYFAPGEAAAIRANLLDERAEAILSAVKENPRVSLKCFCEGMAGTEVVLKSCITEP
jgi:hypothetical protein